MRQPCKKFAPCPADGSPLTGYNAEATDALDHIGLGWSQIPPPLNFPFSNPSCFTIVTDSVAQPANQFTTDLNALAQSNVCAAENWTNPDGSAVQTYQSASQSVQELCPDGSVFIFGVVAGLYVDLSQAQADAEALSYCQRQISLHQVCLSGIQEVLCLNTASTLTVTAQGFSIGTIEENLWELSAGSLPPGMTFNGGSIASESVTITGSPTTTGTFPFNIRVTTPEGDFMEKAYSITVVGVVSGTLSSGTVFVAYNAQLLWNGFQNPTFSVDPSSALPPGLSMSASGVITGTPSTAGTYNVLLDVTDAVANCQQQVQITVSAFPVYTIIPDMLGDIAYFNGGASLPFGTYVVNYINGAVNFRGHWCLNLFLQGGTTQLQYHLINANGTVNFPGTSTDLGSQAAVEAANQGESFSFKVSGQVGMYLTHFPLTTPIAGTPAPTFSLTRIA